MDDGVSVGAVAGQGQGWAKRGKLRGRQGYWWAHDRPLATCEAADSDPWRAWSAARWSYRRR